MPLQTQVPGSGFRLPPSSASILNTAVPGLPGLTQSASTNIGNLLNGMPSTSVARKANAYFGAGSGMAPGSDFVRNRGYDVYGEQVDQRNQQGLQDLLSMLSGYGGLGLQQRGQDINADQFNQQHNLELEKFGFDKQRYFDATRPRQIQQQNAFDSPLWLQNNQAIDSENSYLSANSPRAKF